MYAIIQTGGKQYRVAQGDLLQVELLEPAIEKVTFDKVCLVSNGRETLVGTPRVDGASVTGTVIGTGRRPKILVFKKKRRKHYKRTIGHRQYFTAVRIEDIDTGGKLKPLPAKAGSVKAAAGKKVAGKKKTAVRKTVSKKATARKAPAKKAPAKKARAKKATAKKATARKTTTKKKTAPKKKAASKKRSSRS
ncbi:MAG: 50S ribosomal protein L21 [Acidobacteria bacterium]|nr:50S ribosomal protein L21 [Acidobacteriota bacterium]